MAPDLETLCIESASNKTDASSPNSMLRTDQPPNGISNRMAPWFQSGVHSLGNQLTYSADLFEVQAIRVLKFLLT